MPHYGDILIQNILQSFRKYQKVVLTKFSFVNKNIDCSINKNALK